MGRRLLVSVFVVMAAVVAVEAGSPFVSALGGSRTPPLLHFWDTLLQAGVTTALSIFIARRRPARPPVSTGTALVVAGEALALVAGAWMLASTVALGRCFGVLPEARGLVTHGPYRLVRHPLYLGEFSLCAGLVLASPSTANLLLAAVF